MKRGNRSLGFHVYKICVCNKSAFEIKSRHPSRRLWLVETSVKVLKQLQFYQLEKDGCHTCQRIYCHYMNTVKATDGCHRDISPVYSSPDKCYWKPNAFPDVQPAARRDMECGENKNAIKVPQIFYRTGYKTYLLFCCGGESSFDRLVDPGSRFADEQMGGLEFDDHCRVRWFFVRPGPSRVHKIFSQKEFEQQ